MIGEPGIGKSRLASESERLASAAGMVLLRGRGSSVGPTVPFRPFAEALMSLSRGGESPLLAELGAYRPILSRLIPDFHDLATAPVDTSLLVLAEAVLRLVSLLSRKRGVLLILEDLHDADAETLALVEYLVDNLRDIPTMLLATSRNVPCGGLTLAHAAAQRHTADIIELPRLEVGEVRELAASCLEIGPDEVPDTVQDALWSASAGNPLMVEELLHGMVSSGQLTRGTCGWRMVGELRPEVPATFARSVGERSERLGVDGRLVLSAAAVLGSRFPLPVVQRISGLDDHSFLGHLRAGVAAQLITGDKPAPDWYAFQHPLIGEALLSLLTPIERADLSRRAADAVEEIYEGLSGEWCQVVATLRADAGDTAGAARQFIEAGRRALADGAPESAVTLLERARQLGSGHLDGATLADILEMLLNAYAEWGRFDRAFELADLFGDLDTVLTTTQRATLHARLAWVCDLAGRWSDGVAALDTARMLLGPDPADEHAALIDSIAAELALNAPGPDRLVEAENLARRAVLAAERSDRPAIACQAWLTIAVVTRRRDLAESDSCLRRALALAEEHRLPPLRTYAQYLLGTHSWLADGSTAGLELAGQDARSVGAVIIACSVDASIVMHHVLRGEFEDAARQIPQQAQTANRLQMAGISRSLMVASATLAAHQGRRRDMERALAEFREAGGARAMIQALALGLAQAFCALLEEDADGAVAALVQMSTQDQAQPTSFSLAGQHGLQPFLGVLRGELGRAELDKVRVAPASAMRWNRQFVLLADAVLLGRSGRPDEAMARFTEAAQAAAIYPMARNLGLRLVAEPAHLDGWGDPRSWLAEAEDYFHTAGIPAVASACRALLRRVGGPVRQWRADTHRVPAQLRQLGVTTREFEVLELLVLHLTNKAIASRLHISPRTVEKHVANLMTKFAQPDRQALIAFTATLRDD